MVGDRGKHPWTALVLLGQLALLACSEREPANAVSIRDSAGITIVESRSPAWEEDRPWAVGPTLLDIHESGDLEEYQFHRVSGVRRLSDGTIAVLNHGSLTIRTFGPDGRFLKEFGGGGDGPGEFRALTDMIVLPGDTLVVWDVRQRRVTYLTLAGEHIRSSRLDWTGREGLYGIRVLPDRRIVAKTFASAFTENPNAGVGLHRAFGPVPVFRPDGSLLDTLGVFPNYESVVIDRGEGVAMMDAPFPKHFYYDVRGHSILVGTADAVEVEVWDVDDGLLSIFRTSNRDFEDTKGDREWYRDQYLTSRETPEDSAELVALVRALPFSDSRAAFTDLRLDAEGHIWLRTGRHLYYYAPSREWTVLSKDGHWLGTITLPENFELHQVGSDYLLGTYRDEWGRTGIRMLELQR